jgi:transcriptional regulator with XRE-family HTH domain
MPPTSPTTVNRLSHLSSLGELIRTKRRAQRVTLPKLAETTGLSKAYLSNFERGLYQDIGVEKFSRIVAALNLSADAILKQSGHLPTVRRK